jgi:phosphoglycolate phosphatase
MTDIIIFDFDGVMADTRLFMLQTTGEICAQLGHPCTPTPADQEALDVMSFDNLGRQVGLPEHLIPEYTRRILAVFNDYPQPMPAVDSIAQVIEQLASDHRLGLVTGNGAGVVRKFLVHYGLEQHFEVVSTLEDPGSRVEKIQRILAALGNEHAQAYMIGDSVSDILAARQAGISSVAVTWGHQSTAKLRRAGPDFIIEAPADLLTLLN